MEVLYEVSAGIDVHRDTVVVSIRKRDTRGKEQVETRTFETFHDSLVQMSAWLDEHQVPIVGLESTGVYWKPVVRALQLGSSRRVLWLVNPAEVKKVPGRKTDVKDSEWLSKLVMHGLVSPSFLPPPELEELRKLTRYRTRLIAEQTSCKNRVLKELESSGVKLASVCSDVFGKSGRAMLDALLEGSCSAAEIADLALGRMRSKLDTIARAVDGGFSAATQFVLKQLRGRLDQIQSDLQALDAEIQQRLVAYQPEVELLKSVPGLELTSIAAVVAETGPDMSVFGSADQLAAWSGLAPGSNESAGKTKSAPTRKGDKYLRTMLVQAAWAAVKTRGAFWKQKFGQLVARLGPKKAIVAIARKMLVAIFYILRDATPYRAPEPAAPSPKSIRRLIERVEALGFQVTPRPAAAGA
jgi:Transposase and inactivated derivatives